MGYLRSFKRLAGVFIRTSFQQEFAFRFDFFAKLLNTALGLAGSIGGVAIIFSKIETVNGWSFYETLAVTGIFMFIQSLKNLFIGPSMSSISGLGGELWTGAFDFTLLKPVSTQLYISIRNWSPLVLLDLIISFVVISISIIHTNTQLGLVGVFTFILALCTSLLILYSILLILSSAAFWYLGTPLLWIFDSIMEMGRYPIKVYPVIFRNILTWIVPVGLIVSIPAEVLIGKANLIEVILGMVFAIGIYCIAVLFFKRSLKKYSSASS